MKAEYFSILGVRIQTFRSSEVLERLEAACGQKKDKPLFCVTPNPEICLQAARNPRYRKILENAGLLIPDGFGLLWAGRYLKGRKNFLRWLWTLLTPWWTKKHSPFSERVTGTDIMQKFCKQFPKRKVFLLGASKEVNQRLADQLKKQGTQVVGNYSGDDSEKLAPIICSMITASEAEVLFVAFGAPKQEQWLARHLPELRTVKVAMGVGGAFDFLVGERKRAPKWMRSCGLEWLYRLIQEPSRIKRIVNATVAFPWKVLKKG